MMLNDITRIAIIVISAAVLIFVLALARNFRNLRLRAKIIFGILVTGGTALGFLALFALNSANQITGSLSSRLETSVQRLAEERLINTANSETNRANQTFEKIEDDVVGLASYWTGLQAREGALVENPYWEARASLTQLEGGQYGNSANDVSSVYVPSKTFLTDAVFNDLNASAYLDFSAPSLLENNPSLIAVYAVDMRGITRYYPNINLASILPPDFDPTERPYYKITTPLFNPTKSARWAIPYVEASGGGLVVTVAAPVFVGSTFKGIVAADMKLAAITKQIEEIRIGQTGYAFMIDDAGRIISMPPAGYALFAVDPLAINGDEYFKQTVIGAGTNELQQITNRMVAGGSGLAVLPVNDVLTYLSFAPITANGYSVGVVVPVAELQTAIVTAHHETQAQLQSAVRLAVIILLILFLAAILVSLTIGGIIAAPITRLTETANQIVRGDLYAMVKIPSRDETGILAQAFNTMTQRLRETLAGLEQRVEERTAELTSASRQIEQRALQFESIARVAHTISSSTGSLEQLLARITSAISHQFGFYHVGIFLLDPRGEYAVLSAANSDGGRLMLAKNHKLRVGETGIVGRVAADKKPRVALDTGTDAAFFDNPLLPETRSEMALPLLQDQEVLGVLDVQSTVASAFRDEDISILSILADQVSVAIQNARQLEQTQKALAESESLSRQMARSGWDEFSRSRKLIGIRHSGARATLLYRKGRNGADSDVDASGEEPSATKRGTSLSLPIKMRGELIGTVDVKTPENTEWDQDELEIVNAIIERAALSLENARFLEESQKRALKERTISEISSKISAQSNIEQLLKIAAAELSRTIPGAEVAVQLKHGTELE